MIRRFAQAVMAAAVVGTAGCGGGTGTGSSLGTAEKLTFEGWDAYRTPGETRYTLAQQHFANALRLDPGFSEAHNGLGWVNLQRAGQIPDSKERSLLLEESQINFERATAADPQNTDAWAGLAGLHLAQKNYSGARSAANRALELNPRYFSAHDNIDYRDLHLVLAESMFFLGDFAAGNSPDPNNAVYQLSQLDPTFAKTYKEGNLTPPDIIRKIEELQEK